jgi:hypothetical protein
MSDDVLRLRSIDLIWYLGACDGELLYRAMDWLLPRQPQSAQALARRHLQDRTLV